MPFVRNAWYVAGWSRDFGDALRALRIVDQDSGDVPRLLGRGGGAGGPLPAPSPAPVHEAGRVGDAVQCGYHGMTFDRAGRCVRVPGQSNLPASATCGRLSGGGAPRRRLGLDGGARKARGPLAHPRPAAVLRPRLARASRRGAPPRRPLPQRRREPGRSSPCQLRPPHDAGGQRELRGRAGPRQHARRGDHGLALDPRRAARGVLPAPSGASRATSTVGTTTTCTCPRRR